jgi:hypothetical protein
MDPKGRDDPGGASSIRFGTVVSRRDFLKAAGAAGLGLAGATGLATAAQRLPDRAGALTPGAEGRDPIAELAAALDYDAERIFRFVADDVRYEPYVGILRGARGTLACRAGNSADQALLLAALLDASLLPVRFAIGEIDSATSDALMTSTEVDADTVRRHGLEAIASRPPGSDAAPVELTPEELAELESAVAEGDQVISWAREQLEHTVSTITRALEEAGIELVDSFTPMPSGERTRHVWVQMAATDDWVDLDPTMPGATLGGAVASAVETPDMLPEDMTHIVEIAVIGETLDGDALSEKLLLGYRERSDVLAGMPIAVSNTTPAALTALGVKIAGALGGGDAYVPIMIVGDEVVVGATPISFTALNGQAARAPDPELGLAEATAGDTTAEWVELTIRSPQKEAVVVRRELFDRLGPARRAAGRITAADLAPVDRLEFLDSNDLRALPTLNTHWITVSTGLPSRDDPVLAIAPGDDPRTGALVSQAFHLAHVAAGMELAVPAGLRPFVDAPNVTAFSVIMQPAPDGNHVAETILDVWHRSHGVAAVADTALSLPPNLTSGVLAHITERVLGGEATREDDTESDSELASVGAIFDDAEAEDVSWRVLHGGGVPGDLAWSEDAQKRLEASLANGWVAIAPERAMTIGGRERVGWWLVDPRTGRAVDQLDDGRGGFSEYLSALRVWYEALPAWAKMGWCIFTLARGMVSFLILFMRIAEGNSPYSWKSVLSRYGVGSAVGTFLAFGC